MKHALKSFKSSWLGIGAILLGSLLLWRGVRIATSEQRDEKNRRTAVNIMVIVGMGNNINLTNTRINQTDETSS